MKTGNTRTAYSVTCIIPTKPRYLRRKSEEVVNMLMAEYDYETDIAVHSQEAEARGRAEGEIRGMVTVLYTKLNFSIKNISEELDIKEETVKKILFEKGLIENV